MDLCHSSIPVASCYTYASTKLGVLQGTPLTWSAARNGGARRVFDAIGSVDRGPRVLQRRTRARCPDASGVGLGADQGEPDCVGGCAITARARSQGRPTRASLSSPTSCCHTSLTSTTQSAVRFRHQPGLNATTTVGFRRATRRKAGPFGIRCTPSSWPAHNAGLVGCSGQSLTMSAVTRSWCCTAITAPGSRSTHSLRRRPASPTPSTSIRRCLPFAALGSYQARISDSRRSPVCSRNSPAAISRPPRPPRPATASQGFRIASRGSIVPGRCRGFRRTSPEAPDRKKSPRC